MDPHRKRKIRFVVALTTALLLAGALAYTSFSSASEARSPSELRTDAKAGQVYKVTGRVEKGTWRREGTTHTFRLQDRTGGESIPVRYTGSVPDPFREGREIIIEVRRQGGVYVGEKDSLVTKCPSKFTAEQERQS